MTEDQIKQMAELAVASIDPEARFGVLLSVAQLLYPENEGYIELYKELRQFIREASQNLTLEGFGPVVAAEDALDVESESKTLETLTELMSKAH